MKGGNMSRNHTSIQSCSSSSKLLTYRLFIPPSALCLTYNLFIPKENLFVLFSLSVLSYMLYTVFNAVFYYRPKLCCFLWTSQSLLSAGSLPFHLFGSVFGYPEEAAQQASSLQVPKTSFSLRSPKLNSMFFPGSNMLNEPWRRQRMAALFSSLCFGHSCVSCDKLTVAVSRRQHVIVPLQCN